MTNQRRENDQRLSEEACLTELEHYGTPAHVIRHCREVTRVALKIAEALNQKGYSLDTALLQTAGLLHDIARVEDRHWEAGADFLEKKGCRSAAELVRKHMTYTSDPDGTITEQDILCLADRTVREDEYVGLEARMRYVMDKYKDQKEIYDRIHSKMSLNVVLAERIEGITGEKLDELLKKPA